MHSIKPEHYLRMIVPSFNIFMCCMSNLFTEVLNVYLLLSDSYSLFFDPF